MTGAGAPGAPGIIHCLQQASWINLFVGDANENVVGQYLCRQFFHLPLATDKNYADKIIALCKRHGLQVVLPLVSKELLPLTAAKDSFRREGIEVMVSSPDAISIANNKAATYKKLFASDIPVPPFEVARTLQQFIEAADKLGFPQKPFCFKPSESNGSRGFRIVHNELDESDLLFNHKPYQSYIKYEHAIAILKSKAFPELLVSEYLPGKEYSVDCLAENGKAKLIVPRLRERMINGISVQGTFVNDQQIIDYCKRIIELLGLHGNIGIQLKQNADGVPLLLEINPRVQGTIVAALGAGVNLPLLAIKQQLGMPIEPQELTPRWNTKFWRYWTEVYA